jgi:hypothetical protein
MWNTSAMAINTSAGSDSLSLQEAAITAVEI